MSNNTNDNITERAYEVLEEVTNHPSGWDIKLANALDNNDLEEIKYWTKRIEGELAQEHFSELLGENDAY